MLSRRVMLAFFCFTALLSAKSQVAPQTPRQAVIEILSSRDGRGLLRHLPSTVLGKLRAEPDSGEVWARIAEIWGQGIPFAGAPMKTFESGPILAVLAGPAGGRERTEFAVERDEVLGDEARIDIRVRWFDTHGEELGSNGQNATVFQDSLAFIMKKEDGVWRLTRMDYDTELRLDDEKALEDYFHRLVAGRPERDEEDAIGAVRIIDTAEVTYSTTYEKGFTCSLADLGPGSGQSSQANERQAQLLDAALASGKKSGYIFVLSGCPGGHSTTFRVTAVPEVVGKTGRRAFCSDESGDIRFSDDGKAETCWVNNKPLR